MGRKRKQVKNMSISSGCLIPNPKPLFDSLNFISAADEKLLLRYELLFEKEHNLQGSLGARSRC